MTKLLIGTLKVTARNIQKSYSDAKYVVFIDVPECTVNVYATATYGEYGTYGHYTLQGVITSDNTEPDRIGQSDTTSRHPYFYELAANPAFTPNENFKQVYNS